MMTNNLLFIILYLMSVQCDRGPPKLTSQVNRKQNFIEGEMIKLKCPVTGWSPILEWIKDGRAINDAWDRYKQDFQELHVIDASRIDSGIYVCKATNGFGSLDVRYLVYVSPKGIIPHKNNMYMDQNEQVYEAPKFVDLMNMNTGQVVQLVENSIHLSCEAVGYPEPIVLWFKDNIPINKNVQDTDWIIDDDLWEQRNPFVMHIAHLKVSDSGEYSCFVYNNVGSINFTHKVDVVNHLAKPKILKASLENSTINSGEQYEFQCEVESRVQPTIQWLKKVDKKHVKNFDESTFEVEGDKFIILDSNGMSQLKDGTFLSIFLIRKATPSNAGMYVCLAANAMGYSSASTYLEVLSDNTIGHDISDDNFSLVIIISVPVLVVVILLILVCLVTVRRHQSNAHSSHKNSPSKSKKRSPQCDDLLEENIFPYQEFSLINPYVEHSQKSDNFLDLKFSHFYIKSSSLPMDSQNTSEMYGTNFSSSDPMTLSFESTKKNPSLISYVPHNHQSMPFNHLASELVINERTE